MESSYVTFWKWVVIIAFCGEMFVAAMAGSLGWKDVKELFAGLAERHAPEGEPAGPADT